MPAYVKWIDEPLIMGADYVGHVSTTEIEHVMRQCLATVEQGPCYFLVDTSKLDSLTPDILKIGLMRQFLNHPNTRWLVFVGLDNIMVRFAVQMLVRGRVNLIKEREEALAFLRERIATETAGGSSDTAASED